MIRRILDVAPTIVPIALLLLLLGLALEPPLIDRGRVAVGLLVSALALAASLVGGMLPARIPWSDERRLRRAVMYSGLLTLFGFLAYVALATTLIESPQGTTARLPVGLAYSRQFRDILSMNNGDVVATKEEFEFDLQRIYQPWSVVAAIVLLATAWVSLFFAATFSCSAYLRLHRLEARSVGSIQQAGVLLDVAKTTSGLERTIRARIPQLNLAVFRERATEVEGQVGRLEIDGNAAGTAFLVGADVVLTNYHVVESLLEGELDASRVSIRFDYKVLPNAARANGVVVPLHATRWLLDASAYAECETRGAPSGLPTVDELDYALLRLARSVGSEEYSPGDTLRLRRRGWLKLPERVPELALKAPLIIVQHPDGAPLKFAIDTEAYLGPNGNRSRIRYTTNTEPGSSGSPVFDLDWNLVAIHNLGDPAFDKLAPEFNQGIPADAIRKRIVNPAREGAAEREEAISASLARA